MTNRWHFEGVRFSEAMHAGFAIILSFAWGGCSTAIAPGTYAGTFTAIYDTATLSGETTLWLSDGHFNCEGNENRIPAGGSGTFTHNRASVTFNDENMWTADFDWNLILKGEYQYSAGEKDLHLFRRIEGGATYQYHLRRQQEK